MTEGDLQPRISVVIPNLNSGPTLERCIRSLLDQEYPNLEVIVADGGSTDRSAGILRAYESRIAKVLREADRGQADALNKGFRHAAGDIFGWLCADDELLPGALHHVAGLFQLHAEIGIVAGACELVFEGGARVRNRVAPDAWDAIRVRNTLDQPSVFWRADWWRRAGELDTGFDLAFDWEYWCRLKQAGARLAATPRMLSRYHFSAANKTSTGGRRHVDEGYRVVRRYGPRLVADAYRFVYRHFDLHGCLDPPPWPRPVRRLAYLAARRMLRTVLGRPMDDYPWHFASLQERGLRWYGGYDSFVQPERYDHSPPVTIVTPVMHERAGLEETAESVRSQDYGGIEHLVLNANSNGQARFRGRTHAINHGIRQARGGIVGWLSPGDVLLPGAVRRAVAELAATPGAPAVYGGGFLVAEGGERPFPAVPFSRNDFTALSNYVQPPPVMFRKEIFAEIGYLDEDLHWTVEWDLLARIAKRYDVAYLPAFQVRQRERNGGAERRMAELARLRRRHGEGSG